MSFYEHWVLPPLFDLVIRQHQLGKYRLEVVACACGCVLEIGVGSGFNLPLDGKETEVIIGLDPSERLLSMARRRAAGAGTFRSLHALTIDNAGQGNSMASCGLTNKLDETAIHLVPDSLITPATEINLNGRARRKNLSAARATGTQSQECTGWRSLTARRSVVRGRPSRHCSAKTPITPSLRKRIE